MAATRDLELPVEGMSWATCAGRMAAERPRRRATVNYATERATVDFTPAVPSRG
jgi:hypothetical protein